MTYHLNTILYTYHLHAVYQLIQFVLKFHYGAFSAPFNDALFEEINHPSKTETHVYMHQLL